MNWLTIVLLFSMMQTTVGASYSHTYTYNTGIAKYYRPGLMERVARYRGIHRPWYVTGLASRPSCKTIGQVFSARINGHYERLLQVDCAQYRDYWAQIRGGLVVEVDYVTARRDGFVWRGRAPAAVWN